MGLVPYLHSLLCFTGISSTYATLYTACEGNVDNSMEHRDSANQPLSSCMRKGSYIMEPRFIVE